MRILRRVFDMGASDRSYEGIRAWAEIDLGALAYNVTRLRAILPVDCKLMAVVKADAYGHGARGVAEGLSEAGVDAFAVATLAEGIVVRECVPEGLILIMGYTPSCDAGLLKAHQLTQLVVDGAHATALDSAGCGLPVHIAVDTGMHRLGIEASNIHGIESILNCKNLRVTGIATHLAASDSLDRDDVRFSNEQVKLFYAVIDELRGKGFEAGKLHIQASYGVLNLPELQCDYARVGIALYGVKSHNSGTALTPPLRPVLSLRAMVAQVRWIGAGESVSYGRTYIADRPVKLATLCIGYCDGVPRQMSGNGGMCIIRGRKVPIIGRVCMDLIMADVTEVEEVEAGDVATIIGRDGEEEIRCEDVAAASGTISNDILCRLGSRLPRFYVKGES